MLPLKPCLCPLHLINLIHLEPCLCPLHLINLSPFVINGKGIFPFGAAPPDRLSSYGASSCTSKTYKISIQKAFIFGVEITPSLWRRYSKASRGSGFVKMSATCSFVPTYSTMMFFYATYSRRKWYLIGMWLVLECITRFFEILMALVLSQYIGMGSWYSTCISIKVCFIQITCVQHAVVAIYSAWVVARDTDDCFLLIHDTKHSPK